MHGIGPYIKMTKSITKHATLVFAEIAIVVVLWVLIFKLNAWLFTGLMFREHVNWIFLPAAIRVLAVLLFGWKATVGLFIGALLTANTGPTGTLSQIVIPSLLSALSPLIAVTLVTHVLKLASDLQGLKFEQLAALSFAGAGLSAATHIAYFSFQANDLNVLWGFFPMFAGDLVGTMLVLYMAHFAIRFFWPSPTDRRF
jgi:hypothetical protein